MKISVMRCHFKSLHLQKLVGLTVLRGGEVAEYYISGTAGGCANV